jgi:hypothetical protein
VVLGSTHLLSEMSTTDFTAGKGWPVRNTDNLTAIYEPIVQKIGSLDVSQPSGSLWPVTEIALSYRENE